MASANISMMALTVIATAALTANRAASIAGAVPAAGATSFGIARSDAAIGEAVTVDVMGTAIAEVGAAVAKGAALEVGANGKLITKTSGVTVARALEAGAGDGSMIEVLLITN